MNGNNGKCGKLFVIEGLDGCGKSTQLEMLKASADSNIRFISFPNYNSASGEIIKDYLSGKFCEEKHRNCRPYMRPFCPGKRIIKRARP